MVLLDTMVIITDNRITVTIRSYIVILKAPTHHYPLCVQTHSQLYYIMTHFCYNVTCYLKLITHIRAVSYTLHKYTLHFNISRKFII